jgi:prophage regulatory protein
MTAPIRLLRLPEVVRLTGYSRDSVYRLAREGKFPKRIELSERASRWREDEITAWIEGHSAARHKGATA